MDRDWVEPVELCDAGNGGLVIPKRRVVAAAAIQSRYTIISHMNPIPNTLMDAARLPLPRISQPEIGRIN